MEITSEQLRTATRRLRAAGCVFAEEEASLLADAAHGGPEHLGDMVARRVEGEPLEVIVGWAMFCGQRIEVDRGVFVPRQRTAFLVEQAISLARPGALVVDLCCGSGAIGVAVRAAVPGITLHAADIDVAAVRCARRNVAARGGQVHQGDLYDALPPELRGRIDLLLVNAPYVPSDEIPLMPREARDHEPRHALDGGADGVECHRRVAASATSWLRAGGYVLIEASLDQASTTADVLTNVGLRTQVETSAELYTAVVIGSRIAVA